MPPVERIPGQSFVLDITGLDLDSYLLEQKKPEMSRRWKAALNLTDKELELFWELCGEHMYERFLEAMLEFMQERVQSESVEYPISEATLQPTSVPLRPDQPYKTTASATGEDEGEVSPRDPSMREQKLKHDDVQDDVNGKRTILVIRSRKLEQTPSQLVPEETHDQDTALTEDIQMLG